MEELLKMVTDKTGISPEQAKGAVDTVLGFLKDKIPGIGGQIDGLLKGGAAGMAKDIAGKVGL